MPYDFAGSFSNGLQQGQGIVEAADRMAGRRREEERKNAQEIVDANKYADTRITQAAAIAKEQSRYNELAPERAADLDYKKALAERARNPLWASEEERALKAARVGLYGSQVEVNQARTDEPSLSTWDRILGGMHIGRGADPLVLEKLRQQGLRISGQSAAPATTPPQAAPATTPPQAAPATVPPGGKPIWTQYQSKPPAKRR